MKATCIHKHSPQLQRVCEHQHMNRSHRSSLSATCWDGRTPAPSYCRSFNLGLIRMLGLRHSGKQSVEWMSDMLGKQGVITAIKALIGQAEAFRCWLSGDWSKWARGKWQSETRKAEQGNQHQWEAFRLFVWNEWVADWYLPYRTETRWFKSNIEPILEYEENLVSFV